MNLKIDTIQIRNFRGVRCIDLPVQGHNLIIAGENGAGKSSIVDALEYYLTGRVKQLEGRIDVDQRQCIPNLKGGPTEVTVDFRGVSPEARITIGYPGRSGTIPSSLQPFFDIAAKRAFVLRRHQVLQFINARDSERYEQISQLIGLGALDAVDDNWRKEKLAAQKRVDELHEKCQEIRDRLVELLNQPVRTQAKLVQAVNAQLTAQQLEPITGQEDLEQRLKTLRQYSRFRADITKAEILHTLQERVSQVPQEIDALLSGNTLLQESMQAFWQQSAALEDASLERLLAEGYRIFQDSAGFERCPLCEAPIPDFAALLQRLSERAANLRALTQTRKQISELKTSLEDALTSLGTLLYTVSDSLDTYELTTHQSLVQAAIREIRSWQRSLDQLDRDAAASERWRETPAIAELQQTSPQIAREVSDQIQLLASTEAEATLLDSLMKMSRVDEQWRRLLETETALRKANCVSQQINRVYDELVAARKRGLERLRQELEEDFERFYQQLHPDEGYEAITIPVQPEKRSSVALRAKYCEQDETHPLSYFSEGHLDSLGLCIFLAFIKRFSSDLKLIVLDDVLTTVDAGHRLRVARLLAQEFPDYQFVVTTHDQLWAKELERVIPNAKLVPLRRWSLDQGVDCWQDVLSDWEYYEEQARSGRPQDAIAGAGRNLEKFLYQMRSNLGLAVPAKPDDDYTIGDLHPDFFKWVNKHPLERPDRPQFVQELKALENELDEVWRLRNWSGAHFNRWAETVTSDEALSFVGAIKRLVTAFECPVCKSLVFYDQRARALLCPNCEPSPPPRVVWEYKPGWHARAVKLMQAQKPKVRRNVVPMVENTFESFLRDARHRLDFPVPAQPYDRYDVEHLYTPFFEWAATHPRSDAPDCGRTIERRKQALDAYWQGDHWVDMPDTEVEAFIGTVRQLTSLFECTACSQLLDYDHQQGGYLCAKCNEQEAIPSPLSAYWFVRK